MDNQQFARIVPKMGGGYPFPIKPLIINILTTRPLYKWQSYPIAGVKKIPSNGCFCLVVGSFITTIEEVKGDW
jgi:hypothetical protein